MLRIFFFFFNSINEQQELDSLMQFAERNREKKNIDKNLCELFLKKEKSSTISLTDLYSSSMHVTMALIPKLPSVGFMYCGQVSTSLVKHYTHILNKNNRRTSATISITNEKYIIQKDEKKIKK